MATRKRRRRVPVRKKPARPPPPAITRQRGPLEQKVLTAVDKVLDIAVEDPERLVRMGEGLIDGFRDLSHFLQEHPDTAKRVVRDTIISNVAKAAKKKLREK